MPCGTVCPKANMLTKSRRVESSFFMVRILLQIH